MQFQFIETMQGQVEKQDSAPLCFYFTIKAQSQATLLMYLVTPSM